MKKIWSFVMVCAVMGAVCVNRAQAQAAPADLSPDVQEVVKLSQQHMDDSVITNYIISSGKSYKLSADDIIYLNGQGVSQGVISALLQTGASSAAPTPPATPTMATAPTPPPTPIAPVDITQTPAPAPDSVAAAPAPEPPPTDTSDADAAPLPPNAVPAAPDMAYFQAQLAPYGNWVDVPAHGLCWQPAVYAGWRPYYDGGHWEYTDAGWYWVSDYPWGDITFHYGRWTYTNIGWVWVPGYDYAPAWVVWRHDDDDGYIGWAPLPPSAVFMDGAWTFHGARVGVDFGFGLGVNFFTFIGYDHFWEHNYRPFLVPHDRVIFAFGHSDVVSHYAFDHGHFVNVGLPHDHMVVFTHQDFHAETMATVRAHEEQHNYWQRQGDIHNFNPGTSHPNANGGWEHQQQNGWGH